MVYKVATVDGEYADEEKGIIENYKKEMEVTEIPETDTIDGLVKYFSGKSETIKKIGEYAFMSSEEYEDRIINVYCDAVVPPELDGGYYDYPFAYGRYHNYDDSCTVGGRSFKVYVVSGSESAYKEANMWKKAQSIEAYK